MVSSEFAIIDGSGRLVIRDTTRKGETTFNVGSDVRVASEAALSFAAGSFKALAASPEPRSSATKGQTEVQDFAPSLGDSKPSLPLRTWLDYYQASSSADSALDKLKARRGETNLGRVRDEQEPSGHLDNSMCWLDRVAGAVTLLQEMRKEHITSMKQDSILPVGRMPSGLLAEWAGSEAVDILAEALPQLVDQVDLYEDSLAVRARRNRDEQELQKTIASLREELKAEKRQREYYWRKFREMQQGNNVADMGMEAGDGDDGSHAGDVPIYTEADMKALKKKFLAQMEALEVEWRERLEAEKKRAREEAERMRAEIADLRSKLEAALQPQPGSQGVSSRRGLEAESIVSDAPGAGGTPLPTIASKPGQKPSDSGGKSGQRGRSADKTAPVPDGISGPARITVRPPGHRTPSGDSAEGPESSIAGPSATRETSPELLGPVVPSQRSRPATAHAPTSQLVEEAHRFLAKSWAASPSEDDQRRMAEELKRRVFQSVLDEERRRQEEFEEQEQNALAARWEVQGHAELTQLVRRIDDLAIRRDIFRLLKTYCKRSPQAMEIVCVYCRRKPRPEQIHSFDTQPRLSRPASAGRIGGSASSITVLNPLPSTALGTGLPKVASSPSLTLGSIKGFEDPIHLDGHAGRREPRQRPYSGRPPKLVAVMPMTPGLTPLQGMTPVGTVTSAAHGTPEPSAFAAPVGWAPVDAAC